MSKSLRGAETRTCLCTDNFGTRLD